MPPDDDIPAVRANPRFMRPKRVALTIATLLASLNIWTGCPLLAVWVGSRFVPDSGLSMGAIGIVIVVLAASVLSLAAALTWLSAKYDELTDRPAARQTSPWLRSMRGERETLAKKRQGISAIERIVVLSVVAAVAAFEAWFFFFAGSSLPNS